MLRVISDEPSPGQVYSLEARKHVATLRQREPTVKIEHRLCPAHKGVPGNEKTDEWAKLATDEPDARAVEHLRHGRYGDQPGGKARTVQVSRRYEVINR
jgi:hypothetical protein